MIEPAYFQTMQTRVLAGREFSERDNLNAPRVVVVYQAIAKKYWPRRRRRWDGGSFPGGPATGMVLLTVVGIVHDVKQSDWQAVPFEELYFPFLQSRDFLEEAGLHVASMSFVVRTSGEPGKRWPATVENAIHGVDRSVLVSAVTTMESAIARGLWRQRLSLLLLGIFSLVALALAVTGVYGVVSHSVAQRTQELGIRMALGAGRGAILWLAVRQGMMPVWIGGALGLVLSVPAGRLMQAMLFEVKPADPVTLAGVAVLLVFAGLLANWWPALRASRVDPLAALRDE